MNLKVFCIRNFNGFHILFIFVINEIVNSKTSCFLSQGFVNHIYDIDISCLIYSAPSYASIRGLNVSRGNIFDDA